MWGDLVVVVPWHALASHPRRRLTARRGGLLGGVPVRYALGLTNRAKSATAGGHRSNGDVECVAENPATGVREQRPNRSRGVSIYEADLPTPAALSSRNRSP